MVDPNTTTAAGLIERIVREAVTSARNVRLHGPRERQQRFEEIIADKCAELIALLPSQTEAEREAVEKLVAAALKLDEADKRVLSGDLYHNGVETIELVKAARALASIAQEKGS